jgi:dihydroflavonol-4-reductase
LINLLTGANGFIGSHVARLLVERGETVRVLLRRGSDARALEGLPVERVYGDLRDPRSLRAALRAVGRVFHLAADYRLWSKNPREIYETNVTGTRNLLAAAREEGIERFIYTSSVSTIAVPRDGCLPAEDTQATLDEMVGHYKRSKFLAEQEALLASQAGLPLVIVNPTAPVGPGDWKPTPTGQIILDFLNGKMPAYVDTGLNVVPVEDAAWGHLLAADRGRVGERYILGGRNMTLKEIFDILSTLSGRPSPRLRLPYAVALAAGYADTAVSRLLGREPRIPLEGVRMARHKMFVDCSKAPRDLGFRAGSVEGALERAVRWYTDNNFVGAGRQPQRRPAAA